MAYQQHTVSALIVVNPAKARATILRAFRKAQANRRVAAEVLGCSEVTLWRWVTRLAMSEDLNLVEEEAQLGGWHRGLRRVNSRPKGGV